MPKKKKVSPHYARQISLLGHAIEKNDGTVKETALLTVRCMPVQICGGIPWHLLLLIPYTGGHFGCVCVSIAYYSWILDVTPRRFAESCVSPAHPEADEAAEGKIQHRRRLKERNVRFWADDD